MFCATYFTPVVDTERGFGSILPRHPILDVANDNIIKKPILIGLVSSEMAFAAEYIDYLSK